MKKIWILMLAIAISSATKAQSVEVQQLLLNYEKLKQLKNILSDMKKGYEIVSKGYNTIKDISEGNFNLHDAFINSLLSVNPEIKNYKKVADIVTCQKNIVMEYKSAFSRFKHGGTFSASEIEYLGKVYGNLFNQSLQNLDDLATVLTSNKLSMSDNERLEAIDRIFADTEDKLVFLRDFNKKTNILAIQRSREKRSIETSEKLHQVNH
ncbi:TerB family tellurite resistance protein [Paradesertivirga mongoliensis]|uniref:TerB family tellurite resistance protein n=1 Tax=Paradesertivirga mongoliensis TaxID=2100740 RepID=A0ABW4ZRU9_9SPHI|nr:TerB family tellurite resistance protein [Pedobacter mongoliensis]